jgi:hypothetical protein
MRKKKGGNDLLFTWIAQLIELFCIFVCASYYKSGFEFHVMENRFVYNTQTNKQTN